MGLPWWLSGKGSACQCRRCRNCGLHPWVGKDPLEKEMATHYSILARKTPWTEEHGGLQSMRLQRVGRDWETEHSHTHTHTHTCTHARTCAHTCMCTHMHAHMHMHTHEHAHTHNLNIVGALPSSSGMQDSCDQWHTQRRLLGCFLFNLFC